MAMMIRGSKPGESERLALEAVATAQTRVVEAQADLRDAVDTAREAGASWERVGQALHMTKQAAWEKFGPCYR